MKGLLKRIWPVGLLLAWCMLVLPNTMLAAEQQNDVYVNGVDTVGMAKAANETVTIIDSGTCGENLTWTLDSAGTLTISGTGEMEDYSKSSVPISSSAPWQNNLDLIEKVFISYGVLDIGDCAFAYCGNLTSINIPDSVTSIGSGAFDHCWRLTSITIPSSVTSIDSNAFNHCDGLFNIFVDENNNDFCSLDGVLFNKNHRELIKYPAKKVGISYNIPNGVTSIGDYCFYNCSGLTSIIIPNSVTSIGRYGFYDCSGLTDITVPNSVTSIGYGAFMYCCGLTSITIPNSVTSIGGDAFYHCSGLTSIIIPNSVTGIGDNAFAGCSGLTSIIISDNITSIGFGVFQSCNGLTSITIPSNVTSIGDNAFYYCRRLTNVTIPSSVTSIGDDAFCLSSELKNVYYSGSKSQWDNINIESGNGYLINATIHYNSTDPDNTSFNGSVNYLAQYNAENKQIFFGNSNLAYNITDTTEIVGTDSIEQLVDKYVLVETNPDDIFQVVKISAVESKIGVCSAVGTNSITIDRVSYTTPEDWILDLYDGKQLLYHISDGKLVGAEILQEKESILEEWSNETKTVKIGGETYPVNYLTDLSFLANIDQNYGKEVSYFVGSSIGYTPVFKVFVHSYETKLGLFSHYDPISNAAFIDSISYAVDFTKCSIDNNALNGKKVFFLLDNGQIIHIDAAEKLKPTLEVSFNPGSAKFIYQSGAFDKQSINVDIAVGNKIGYNFPKGYDTAKIYENSDVGDITLKSAIWQGDDKVKLSAINANGVIIKPLERKVVIIIVEPKQGRKPDNKTENITSKLVINANIAGSGEPVYVEKNFITTINNADMGGSTPVEPDDGKRKLTFWEKAFLENIYNVDDVNVRVDNGAFALSNYFDKSAIDDIGRTVTFWAAVRESQFAQNTQGDLPTCLQIDCKMTKGRYKGHNATLVFYCKSFLGWNYASFSNIKFVLIDRSTKAILVEDGLYSVSVDASAKKFADGIQAYLKVQYGEEMKDFCKELGKDAIKEMISDTATISGKEYLNTMLDIFKNIKAISENAKKFTEDYAGKLSAVLNNDFSIFVKDGKEIDEVLAKHVIANCPVNVYVYNPQGELCASVENDKVTLDTMEIFVDVTDSKKELWLNNGDYRLELVSNDSGTMDYTVEEYSGMEKTRTIFFDDVPLSVGLNYDGAVPEQMNAPKVDYSLKANNGSTVYATSDTNDVKNPPSTGGNSGSHSSGGSSSAGNKTANTNIAVSNIAGGGIGITPKNPLKGDTVTLNIVPDKGYELEQIKVTDSSGNEIKLNKVKENKYTFIMPDSKVKLDATFRKIAATKVEETKVMPFIDVKAGDWFYQAVKFAYEKGLMNGETDTWFKPNNNLNRAMLVTILYRMENTPTISKVNKFSDVAVGQWYTNAVVWASANGIVNGYEDGKFLPMQNVSREEMSAMLMRYAKYKGYDVSKTADLTSYVDGDKVSVWAVSNMQWASGSGLIKGDENNKLNPQGNATRAEAAMILMRFIENISK